MWLGVDSFHEQAWWAPSWSDQGWPFQAHQEAYEEEPDAGSQAVSRLCSFLQRRAAGGIARQGADCLHARGGGLGLRPPLKKLRRR